MLRRVALASIVPLALLGCTVEPFCIDNCGEDGADQGDLGASDAGMGGTGVDGDVPDGGEGPCVPVDGGMELCNGVDDNCDGTIDEGFDLQTNPLHCGRCGNACFFDNGEGACEEGECVFLECLEGFRDLDAAPGCEYVCPIFPIQPEDCNGIDEDCDGVIDEPDELADPPTDLCRDVPGTPCEGVQPVCETREGRTAWFCDYSDEVEFDPSVPNGIVLDEQACDGFDGDCDGVADDSFGNLGAQCDNGERGACRDVGIVVCDDENPGLTECDLSVLPDAVPGAPSAELCNAIDDNCDGVVDNSDPGDPDRVIDDMVRINRSGLDFYVYRYEASRPGATDMDAGTRSARACSQADVLPWTLIGFEAAEAACAAAGHRLCTAAEWLTACEGAAENLYPYGADYETLTCNGADRDAMPGGAIDNEVAPTGSLATCRSDDGIFDLSGNVKEWTDDQGGTVGGVPIYVTRGGSFDSPELGLTCDTVLSQATEGTLQDTLGFRCCSDTAP